MAKAKKIKRKSDRGVQLKDWLEQLNTCYSCDLPLLGWDADFDDLTRHQLYEGQAYAMRGLATHVLCKRCENDEERVLDVLYDLAAPADDIIAEDRKAQWRELFKHAVRLCSKGLKIGE